MDLTKLIQDRDILQQQAKIHRLRGVTIQDRLDVAVQLLQDACPHEDVEHTSSYSSGGYDYVAETRHSWHCTTCRKLVKYDCVSHPGSYA